MGISYLYALGLKVIYVGCLVAAVASVIYGVSVDNKKQGRIAITLGVIAWIFLGMLGLGTGT
jgi:hypothetical protein